MPESPALHYNLTFDKLAVNEDIDNLTTRTRAILFDLDGTLIDTTDLILRCFSHSWQAVYGLEHSRASLIATFGIPLREAMQRLLAQSNGNAIHHDDDKLIEHLLTEYRLFNVANHDVIARPFDGTRQVIEALHGRGYLIGVVTSKGRDLAMRGLRLCELDRWLDTAICLEDTEIHKPEPEPILAALDRLQVSREAAAYVGDSCHDIIAGRRAGVKTVAALWGPLPRTDLECERPDHLAESINDLLDIFP
ncbi:MAG: pyrophosphatase PpaX [Blastocatellia bacterium]